MSAKFKRGDLVELLAGDHPEGFTPGMIGTVIKYSGAVNTTHGHVINNAWELNFPGKETLWCNEKYLRLVPGGDEYKEIGKWSECPWHPYKQKEEIANNIIDLANPF